MRNLILKFKRKFVNYFRKQFKNSKRLRKSRIAILFYYTFIDKKFEREIRSVVDGITRHEEDVNATSKNTALLRRNIHRIEKGLIMQPRRDVFAEEYILETVRVFANNYSKLLLTNTEEVLWFDDVLHKYFSVVDHVRDVERAKALFTQIPIEKRVATNFKPYIRDLNQTIPTYDDFFSLCRRRRSVRWFEQKKVPRNLIEKAFEAALQSPSACNRQPFRFHVFDDCDLLNKVVSIPGGTKGYGHNIPCFILVIGQQRAYFDERDRHVIYIDGSLAAMSFAFALETLGLSSCMINWPDVEEYEQEMAAFANLDFDERVIMCIACGWPNNKIEVPYSHKKPVNELVTYNR